MRILSDAGACPGCGRGRGTAPSSGSFRSGERPSAPPIAAVCFREVRRLDMVGSDGTSPRCATGTGLSPQPGTPALFTRRPMRVKIGAREVEPSPRRLTMPLYLSKFSYTPETWARMISNPEDRRTAAQKYIESVGGKLHGFWYAFGTHDGYNLWEAPDNVSMAAVALAIGAGGALSSLETTVLMTVEETMDALRKAGDVKYRPPGV